MAIENADSNNSQKPQDQEAVQTGTSANIEPDNSLDPLKYPERRQFFKHAAVGGGLALLGGAGAYGATKVSLKGRLSPDYPVIDKNVFKPKDQRDVVLNFVSSKALNEKHPERNEQYNRLQKKQFDWVKGIRDMYSKPWDNNKPGYTQKDRALQKAGWAPLNIAGSRTSANLQPNTPFNSWDQSDVEKEQYQFNSKKEASDAIKTAARVFGAVKCGIARRDKRWDYDPLYDIENEKELSWENDFPFEPKTVIVILTSMDYDCMSTAPAWTADGTAADGYTQMGVKATQMAKFLQGMGYQAVGAGNDLGSSVPYAIMAGLGEGGRNGALLSPGVGPRVRIAKIYTDLDFVEYDEPHTWGMTDFCLSCGKCAEACPADAIPLPSDKDGGYGFEPKYEHADEPGYTWNNHLGIRKFYSDAKKCYNFWVENGSACGACIASCTFNEPDYWHHVFIMGITPWTPGPLHAAMAEAHPAFGYGHTNDPKKPLKFWKTGEGMRTNTDMKNNIGTSNKS
jgi:epoxyqueuosine reductase